MLRRYAGLRYIKNPAIRALLAADALLLTAAAMLAPIYALFVDRVGGDILAAGITAAALAFGSGFVSLLAGRKIDHIRDKRIILAASTAVLGAGFIGYIFAATIWHLAIIQVVMGVVQAIHATLYDALYSRNLDKGREGEQWGAWEALNYFAAGAGALAGGFLVAKLGFEVMFFAMAVLTFASALYILSLPKKLL